MNRHFTLLMGLVLSVALTGCKTNSDIEDLNSNQTNTNADQAGDSTDQDQNTIDKLSLSSLAMSDGGSLPVTYTCDGDSLSPPLSWNGAPEGTDEYAVVMHHVPGPGDTHWYWVMYGIDQSVTHLDADENQGILGTNSVNGLNEYAPLCSQGPGLKSYTFTLYALSESPDLSASLAVDRGTLLSAIENITLESVDISVNYERGSSTDLSR